MSEIRENETTEIFRGKSLPPEFLSGRTLDYAVNMIKDNPLDDTSQNIISRFQEDYPQLKSIFPRTSEELQNLSEKEKKERNRRFQENYKRSGKENVGSASETTGQSIIMADASGNGFYDHEINRMSRVYYVAKNGPDKSFNVDQSRQDFVKFVDNFLDNQDFLNEQLDHCL